MTSTADSLSGRTARPSGYLYMIRPAKELKTKIKLTGSSKQKELKAFLDSVDEKQNVMIVVK